MIALSQDVLVDETPERSEGECIECRATAARARRLAARIRCRCGAELIPPVRTDEALLQRLLDASEQMARWAPYFQGSAIDYDRRREPGPLLTPAEREQLDAKNERARSCARGLFVRLESLRTEAARTRGPELTRAVAVIDWLVERCGSERTKGARIGGEVVAPRLSRLVGEAFADAETRARASARPSPKDERAAEIRALAEQAKVAIERHGAELLRDAAWLWNATDVATEEAERGFEEICGAAITRIKAEQERRKKAKEQR